MSDNKTLDVLRSIAEACLGSSLDVSSALTPQINEIAWKEKLSEALLDELGIELYANEIRSGASLLDVSQLIESRLDKDQMGRSLVDIYTALEQFVREEISHDVHYHWYAKWKGDLIRSSDSLDDVEIVLRVEQAFGFSIPDRDIDVMDTVADTVHYLWRRISNQRFKLRPLPKGVCEREFIFHELRRLLIIRGAVPRAAVRLDARLGDLLPTWHFQELRRLLIIRGAVPRAAVRLDARLGDLLPTWHFQFWKEIQNSLGVGIPHGNLLSRSLGLERRTTIKELVLLIASANN